MNAKKKTDVELREAIYRMARHLSGIIAGSSRCPDVLLVSGVRVLLHRAAQYCPVEFVSAYAASRGTDPTSKVHAISSIVTACLELQRTYLDQVMTKEVVALNVASMLVHVQRHFPREVATCDEVDSKAELSADQLRIVELWCRLADAEEGI